MIKPDARCYGNYKNEAYGLHAMVFTDPKGNDFYFSYETLVAFKTASTGLVCMVNNWKTTTGKHLNRIQPDKKRRVTKEEFDRIFAETFPEEIAGGGKP